MNVIYPSIYWEDVEPGQLLPAFTYELSLVRLISFVRATGLYDYIHFDRDYARAVGMRDAFIATPHLAALFNRLLTEWSGPGADLLSLSFQVKTQCCTDDILQVTGRVGAKYVTAEGAHLVELVDLNIGHALAPQAAIASATMVLPSHAAGPVKLSKPAKQRATRLVNPDLPDFTKPWIGQKKPGPRHSAAPLSERDLQLWCESIDHWNPLYWDRDHGCDSRHGGLIAPPTAIGWFMGPQFAASAGIGYRKPGSNIPMAIQNGLSGLKLRLALREVLIEQETPFAPAAYPEAVVTNIRDDYAKPCHIGDTVSNSLELLDCSAKKQTRLGEGYFLKYSNTFYNQNDELLKTMTINMFYYHP